MTFYAKGEIMFIATLPNVTNMSGIYRMLDHPRIDGARYNCGASTPYTPEETLKQILKEVARTQKKFWLDLKGRQLRVTQWSYPKDGGEILVNHAFTVDLPAQVIFRGDDHVYDVAGVQQNRIYLVKNPQQAVGAGQALNILGNNLCIDGFLTETDREYILASQRLECHAYMLSFVEGEFDLISVLQLDPKAELVLKIESLPGLEFVKRFDIAKWPNTHIMLARDDLMVNIGKNKAKILQASIDVIKKDPDAIAASHLLTSVARGSVCAADLSDLAYLRSIGYKNFLLSDTVSHYYFDEAMQTWEDFLML